MRILKVYSVLKFIYSIAFIYSIYFAWILFNLKSSYTSLPHFSIYLFKFYSVYNVHLFHYSIAACICVGLFSLKCSYISLLTCSLPLFDEIQVQSTLMATDAIVTGVYEAGKDSCSNPDDYMCDKLLKMSDRGVFIRDKILSTGYFIDKDGNLTNPLGDLKASLVSYSVLRYSSNSFQMVSAFICVCTFVNVLYLRHCVLNLSKCVFLLKIVYVVNIYIYMQTGLILIFVNTQIRSLEF